MKHREINSSRRNRGYREQPNGNDNTEKLSDVEVLQCSSPLKKKALKKTASKKSLRSVSGTDSIIDGSEILRPIGNNTPIGITFIQETGSTTSLLLYLDKAASVTYCKPDVHCRFQVNEIKDEMREWIEIAKRHQQQEVNTHIIADIANRYLVYYFSLHSINRLTSIACGYLAWFNSDVSKHFSDPLNICHSLSEINISMFSFQYIRKRRLKALKCSGNIKLVINHLDAQALLFLTVLHDVASFRVSSGSGYALAHYLTDAGIIRMNLQNCIPALVYYLVCQYLENHVAYLLPTCCSRSSRIWSKCYNWLQCGLIAVYSYLQWRPKCSQNILVIVSTLRTEKSVTFRYAQPGDVDEMICRMLCTKLKSLFDTIRESISIPIKFTDCVIDDDDDGIQRDNYFHIQFPVRSNGCGIFTKWIEWIDDKRNNTESNMDLFSKWILPLTDDLATQIYSLSSKHYSDCNQFTYDLHCSLVQQNWELFQDTFISLNEKIKKM